jgi:hypothetical protein
MNTAASHQADLWLTAAKRALLPGTLASVLSTGVLAWVGYRRLGKPFAPTNATSHWLWGDGESFNSLDATVRHTAIGYGTHHASALMWALFYERWLGKEPRRNLATIVTNAALVTGLAAFVDYQLTPKRLTPGFEAHLSRTSMAAVFAAIGVGLAAGALLNRRESSSPA